MRLTRGQLRHRVERRFDAALGNLENPMLGGIEELVDVGIRLVRARRDIGRDGREAAQHRLFAHDARIVRDVGGGRHRVGKLRDVGRAADLFEHALGAQRVGQSDRVDGLDCDRRAPSSRGRFRDGSRDRNPPTVRISSAWLIASFSSRTAPSTDCSASIFCGGTRLRTSSVCATATTPSNSTTLRKSIPLRRRFFKGLADICAQAAKRKADGTWYCSPQSIHRLRCVTLAQISLRNRGFFRLAQNYPQSRADPVDYSAFERRPAVPLQRASGPSSHPEQETADMRPPCDASGDLGFFDRPA